MLHRNLSARTSGADQNLDGDIIDLERLLAVVRRQWKIVAAFCILGMAVAAIYIAFATPLYRATAEILLDQSRSQTPVEMYDLIQPVRAEEEIMSQVELIGSIALAERVVDELDLGNDLQFLEQSTRAGGGLKYLFGGPSFADQSDAQRRSRAVGLVLRQTSVGRLSRTYVLTVSFVAPSGEIAAKIANAIADRYLLDQLEARYEAAQRASEWLEQRLDDLQRKSLAADLEVQRYRAENGLLTSGGQLMSDQQLAAANSSLLDAQSATATAKARLETVNNVLASGDESAVLSAALDNPLINSLQQRYLDLSARKANIVQRVGADHEQAVALTEEMVQLRELMREELARVAASEKNKYETAVSRERNLHDNLLAATQTTTEANTTQAKLRELEAKSQSVRSLYQNFLQSYQATGQSASFPVSGARVINRASPPGGASSPSFALAMAVGVALAGIIGTGVAGLREFRDRFVRTGEHVQSEIGLDYLGMVPVIDERPSKRLIRKKELPDSPIKGTRYDSVLEHPGSQFAETLRATKVNVDLSLPDRTCRVLGIVSLLSEEGKSVLSSNLAIMLSRMGHRVLLIDADVRNPTLSRQFLPTETRGLLQVVLDMSALNDALHLDEAYNLHFIPAGEADIGRSSSDLLSSPGFAQLLELLRQHYDYIFLDLPPLAPVSDARAVASEMDAFLWVVQWGRIPRQFMRSFLERESLVASKTLGVILNRVDLKKLKLYSSSTSTEFYMSSYNKYFIPRHDT